MRRSLRTFREGHDEMYMSEMRMYIFIAGASLLRFVALEKGALSHPSKTMTRACFNSALVHVDAVSNIRTYIRYGGDECCMTSAAVGSKHDVLLGLGVGCTLVLSGVVPIQPNRIEIDGGDAVVEGITAVARDGGHISLPAVTPERQQLTPADSGTPLPPCISENSDERVARANKVRGVAVGIMAATRRGIDPVLAKLIHDNGNYTAVSEDDLHGMPLTAGADLQPATLQSDMNHLEPDETCGAKSGKDVTPTLPKMRKEEGLNQELHDQGEKGRSKGSNADGTIRRRTDHNNKDLKEEADVPDDEWRR